MTAPADQPPIPADLGAAGAALWARLTGSYDFEPWEGCRGRDGLSPSR